LFLGVDAEDITEICGSDTDCLNNIDTNWYFVFEYNGVVMFFLCISNIIMTLGTWFAYARILASC